MKSKVEKELNKKNKRFDFKGVFKNLVAGSQDEISEEKEIYSSLSDQDKEELLNALKNTDNLAHSLFAENIKKAARKTNTNSNFNKANIAKANNIKSRKQTEYGDRAD